MARQRKKWDPNAKSWKQYVDYLDEYNKRTDRVLRDHPYPEFHQFPEDKRDFRDEIDDRLRKEMVMETLMTLTDRERKVLIHRFGIEDGVPKTLDYVAEMFCVGRERVRQLECRALRKMRHPKRSQMLMEPWEYAIRRAEQEARWAKQEEENRLLEEERTKAREEYNRQWKADNQERLDREEREREERYQKRQREAWDKYRAMIEEEVERERLYREMQAKAEEYDRIQQLNDKPKEYARVMQAKAEQYRQEMEKKAKEYQEEARRPYAWCPRTKTKKYLDE